MIAALYAAVKARVESRGVTAHVVTVATPAPGYPYVILWGLRAVPEDSTLAADGDVVADRLAVTSVGSTVAACLTVQQLVRDELDGAVLAVDGRTVDELRLVESRPADVDRDVTIPGTGHPAFAVDFYALSSQA